MSNFPPTSILRGGDLLVNQRMIPHDDQGKPDYAPLDGVADDATAQDGDDVGEAESGIDHERAFGWWSVREPSCFETVRNKCRCCAVFPELRSARCRRDSRRYSFDSCENGKRTGTPQVARKVVLFKYDLVVVFLHVWQIQDGLCQEQVGLLRVDLRPSSGHQFF